MEVSIIIPVYNAEKYLARCIDSILNQTFQDFELILIDDKSTDSSKAICKQYIEDDSRILFVENEKNRHSCKYPWLIFVV
ncbi:glycosyltransferase family 2 protein [Bacteroides finegoldii]|uniref:glycosyltransferase family 2 protein n=1 Tax=Bacteroides finegoldii TaxID=338188 RepID=UPI0022E10026|nr:glycosyltransferase family 2 protein [Bacteroides finegoldii]